MQLLCLSNGHGEDGIALRILQALQRRSQDTKIAALPIVGEGHAFAEHGIAIAGTVKRMPSGGFVYQDGRQLARDVRGGLLKLTLAQRQTVQAWAKSGGVILAVGDIVPLLFAWMSGAPYAFVGTAKSEYYLRDEVGLLPRPTWFERMESWSGSVYLPWERWLMTRSRCCAVFPRDSLTTQVLKKWPIPAFDLGNPMMDGLELPAGEPVDRDRLTFVLLPGSRPPEAYQNWERILGAVQALIEARLGKSLLFLGAIAPQLDLQPLTAALISQGWRLREENCFTQGKATIALSQTNYRDCLHEADFAIAMAGTATEQFVGLGKPALTIAGEGPQFTPKFAEAQTRLLGASAILLKEPRQAPQVMRSILQDPDRLHLIAENGRRRLGASGAADRIADCLLDRLS